VVLIPGHRNPLIPIRALVFGSGSVLFVVLLADWRRKHAGGAEVNATCVRCSSPNRAPKGNRFIFRVQVLPRNRFTTIAVPVFSSRTSIGDSGELVAAAEEEEEEEAAGCDAAAASDAACFVSATCAARA